MPLPSDLSSLAAPARKVRPRAPIFQPMERFTSLDRGKSGKRQGLLTTPFSPRPLYSQPVLFSPFQPDPDPLHRLPPPSSWDFRDTIQYNTTTLFICRFTSRLIGAYLLATSKPVNRGIPSSFTTVKSSPSHWRQDGCASLIFYLVGVENPKICLIPFAQITVLSKGERLTDDQQRPNLCGTNSCY